MTTDVRTHVRFETHPARTGGLRRPARRLPFRSVWWLLALLGGVVSTLAWLGAQSYTVGSWLA